MTNETHQTETPRVAINWNGSRGSVVFRTAMLTTHYTQPHEWKPSALEEAKQVWLKLWSHAEPCDDAPPSDVVKAVGDDLNTPEAIKLMMLMAQKGRKRELYASMRYLGLLPLDGEEVPT